MAGFLFIFLVGAFLTKVGAELSCTPSNSSEMRVTFDSHKNKTGRWTHEIGLERQGLPSSSHKLMDNVETMPWTVDVKYVPKNCEEKQKNSLKVLISFTESRLIPADYEFLPGLGYYKYYPPLVTWDAAKATCDQDGAHLAIINSQQEADALKKMVVNTSVDWAWIGVTKPDAKGEFITIFGDPLSTTGFGHWYSGVVPANAHVNSAAVIHKNAGTLAYNNFPTVQKFVFLCEKY